MAHQIEQVVVMGIAVDESAASRVKKVMRRPAPLPSSVVSLAAERAGRRQVMAISMVFAVLIIANSVMQQIEENGDTMNRLVGLMLGLLVPACGYAGAKNANRSLLSCFWGCNAFSAVCNTMAVAMWILIILVYDEDITSAHQTCYVRRPRPAAAPRGARL